MQFCPGGADDGICRELEQMRFRAAVLYEVGKPLEIDELEMQPLQAGDVLVRIRASGLCHTDLEVIQGSLA